MRTLPDEYVLQHLNENNTDKQTGVEKVTRKSVPSCSVFDNLMIIGTRAAVAQLWLWKCPAVQPGCKHARHVQQ